jgi:hypothetical protein
MSTRKSKNDARKSKNGKSPRREECGSMIAMIVNRCHVGESAREVIRYVRSRMVKGAWRKLDPETRRAAIAQILDQHEHNRGVYVSVMSGRRSS